MAPAGRPLRLLALTGTPPDVAPDEEPSEIFLTQGVRDVIDKTSQSAAPVPAAVPISSGQAGYLVRVAARAPSLHNTQPWRFKVLEDAIELYADHSRQLRTDPIARELLISCGAALYGLRLAVRSLGRTPEVELFPESPRAAEPRSTPLLQVAEPAAVGPGRDPGPVVGDQHSLGKVLGRRPALLR
jgi:hypothetical protein